MGWSVFFVLHLNVFKPEAALAGRGSSWWNLSWRNVANCFARHERVLLSPFPLVHCGFCQTGHAA